jgi:DNA-binding protein HU-beta
MDKPASANKSPAAPKAKTENVSTKQIATELAKKHDLSNKVAAQILEDFVALTTRHLKKGARIRINGLGILSVRKRAARMGRNPATGEQIKIKASKKVSFRPSKELKGAV